MKTLYVVAGNGPNDLTIPLVIFSDKQKAEDFVGLFPKSEIYPSELSYDFAESKPPYVDPRTYDPTPLGKELYGKLFKNGEYYPGCGECYSLEILEVQEEQPMVIWDLS